MLKRIGLVLLLLIAGLLGFAATRPDTFKLERSTVIQAPAAKAFVLLNDFHQWPQWSPWEKLDPAMQRTFSGAPSGVGAVYGWQGNKDVGSGRMEITDAVPNQQLGIQLDFLTPFEAHNRTSFTLAPQGDATRVTWLMDGPSPYISKLMGVFVSMDTMVGKDFESGLANLKAAAER